MKAEPSDLIPIPYSGVSAFPELEDEAYLLQQLAAEPLEPGVARAHVRKKYLIYLLILIFCVGLPLAVFGAVSLGEFGLPRWVSQAGVWLALALFFIFFVVMLALVASRGKVFRYLGLSPAGRAGPEGEAAGEERDYVAMTGRRRGRNWEYGHRGREFFWHCVRALPAFQVAYRDGRFWVDPQAPAALHALLGQIPPRRLWRRLRIYGGSEGLSACRPAPLAKYSLQDLWLAEKILDALRQ